MRVEGYKGGIEYLDWLFPLKYPFFDPEEIMELPTLFGITETPKVLRICLWPELNSEELWNRYAVGLYSRGKPQIEERIISVSEAVWIDFTDKEITAVLGHEIAHWRYPDVKTDEVEYKCDACIASIVGRQPVISALGRILIDTRRISNEATDEKTKVAAANEAETILKRMRLLRGKIKSRN